MLKSPLTSVLKEYWIFGTNYSLNIFELLYLVEIAPIFVTFAFIHFKKNRGHF